MITRKVLSDSNSDITYREMFRKGYMEHESVGHDYPKAFVLYNNLAKRGFVEPQNNIGVMFFSGQGVEKDHEIALEWFLRSSKSDYVYHKTQFNIGLMYYKGYGINKNVAIAETWFLSSAMKGNQKSQYYLGEISFNDNSYEEAKYWYLKSADQYFTPSYNRLGEIYEKNGNIEEAMKWYSKSIYDKDYTSVNKICELVVEDPHSLEYRSFAKISKSNKQKHLLSYEDVECVDTIYPSDVNGKSC